MHDATQMLPDLTIATEKVNTVYWVNTTCIVF